jgi:hypothetical protein
MTTEQTAQQLELAAQILRTGHPWGYRRIAGSRYKYNTPIEVVADGNTLSPLLATPPDGRPLHNPDNLTAEQVGVGYRLLLPVELDGRHKKACEVWNGKNDWSGEHLAFARYKFLSYRLPLSVPWPEPEKPDLYAELKAAHAAGKVVQVIDCGKWLDLPTPNWCEPVGRYRIKPTESAKPEPADPYAEPQTKTVPLDPEDVPPGSVFGKHDRISFTWHQVIGVHKSTIKLSINAGTYAYEQLVEDWQINRSIPLTGKWNPDAWEPCHKKYDC